MFRKLKIAQISPLWFPLPPQKYGGIERVIHYLSEGLMARGHDVTLFAAGDSKTKAKLISITKKHLIAKGVPWADWWWHNLGYSFAFEKAKEFDILHCHWAPLGMYFQRFIKKPVLHTLHNIPPKGDHRWKIFEYYKKDSNVVFISKKQKQNSPVRFKKEWVVYNGIDLSAFKFNKAPKDHFVWIGRITQKKGIENAILAAKKLNLKLLLAGQLQEMEKEYFKKKIKPQLSSKIRYIGELSQNKLSNFYGNARALLYPIEWEEPFGLVVVEAMACGTPVVAFNRGSMPELIENGKTGLVVKNVPQMLKAVKNIDKIDRRACRQRVEKYFNCERMVDEYEKIYYRLKT